MENKIVVIVAITAILILAMGVIGLIFLVKRTRYPYIGEIHVVRDNYDSESYMFLVIRKDRTNDIVNGRTVRLKILEDIPERGRDEK